MSACAARGVLEAEEDSGRWALTMPVTLYCRVKFPRIANRESCELLNGDNNKKRG